MNPPAERCDHCDTELPDPDEPATCYYTGRGPCGDCDKDCFTRTEQLCVDCRHIEHDWKTCDCPECSEEQQLQIGQQVYGESVESL